MYNFIKIMIILSFYLNFYSVSLGQENSFYILHDNASASIGLSSLATHYPSVHILISQAYRVDQAGTVSGSVNPHVLDFANKHSMKIMVLVTNVGFDQDKAHQFLSNQTAQKKALDSILSACHNNHYYGVQFDFEGISIADKNALTNFYQTAYNILHQKGLIVSFAIIPLVAESTQSAFLKKRYENWAGAYDLKALSKNSDFISIMAYDQHEKGTPPGPFAGILWVEAALKYTLKFVPAHKISLGIPTYSGYWYLGNSAAAKGKLITKSDDISYKKAESLLKKYHVKLKWDNDNKINYVIYERNWLNEYLFLENSRSFKAKLNLAKKYNLRGISVFDLGNEDPKIWKFL